MKDRTKCRNRSRSCEISPVGLSSGQQKGTSQNDNTSAPHHSKTLWAVEGQQPSFHAAETKKRKSNHVVKKGKGQLDRGTSGEENSNSAQNRRVEPK